MGCLGTAFLLLRFLGLLHLLHFDGDPGILPVNFDFASAPIDSTTGVARSIPTSAVSSAEKIIGWVRSMRPSATFPPFTNSVPVPPLPIPPP